MLGRIEAILVARLAVAMSKTRARSPCSPHVTMATTRSLNPPPERTSWNIGLPEFPGQRGAIVHPFAKIASADAA